MTIQEIKVVFIDEKNLNYGKQIICTYNLYIMYKHIQLYTSVCIDLDVHM